MRDRAVIALLDRVAKMEGLISSAVADGRLMREPAFQLTAGEVRAVKADLSAPRNVPARFHGERKRLAAAPADLREALLLIAGGLIADDRVEDSASVLVAAARLFPDLEGFVPRVVGPEHGRAL